MPLYKNLVFKGGGVRGLAYLGALKYLYENGLTRSVERVAGTSAGAITAAIVALDLENFSLVKAISDSLEYSKVPGVLDEKADEREKRGNLAENFKKLGLLKNLQCSLRLVQEMGWYSSEYFYNWLKGVIAGQFTVQKKEYTFADFRNPSIHKGGRAFHDLYITGTDLSNRTSRVFSWETTPDMEVASAVRISMSIPLFFEAREYQFPGTGSPQVYADGGVMWNYPITLFDDPKYSRRLSNGLNMETLGFFVYSSPDETAYKEIKGIADYIGALFESLLLVQEHMILYGKTNKERTVFIDDAGVSQTNFDISAGDPLYTKLFNSGYGAATTFFEGKSNLDTIIHKLRTRFGRMGLFS